MLARRRLEVGDVSGSDWIVGGCLRIERACRGGPRVRRTVSRSDGRVRQCVVHAVCLKSVISTRKKTTQQGAFAFSTGCN